MNHDFLLGLLLHLFIASNGGNEHSHPVCQILFLKIEQTSAFKARRCLRFGTLLYE
jgi:hypothetical protein